MPKKQKLFTKLDEFKKKIQFNEKLGLDDRDNTLLSMIISFGFPAPVLGKELGFSSSIFTSIKSLVTQSLKSGNIFSNFFFIFNSKSLLLTLDSLTTST